MLSPICEINLKACRQITDYAVDLHKPGIWTQAHAGNHSSTVDTVDVTADYSTALKEVRSLRLAVMCTALLPGQAAFFLSCFTFSHTLAVCFYKGMFSTRWPSIGVTVADWSYYAGDLIVYPLVGCRTRLRALGLNWACNAGELVVPVVGWCYFPQGLQLPSEPKSIDAIWPVPNYTAWWQRHMGVNNLSKVVAQHCPSGSWTCEVSIASPVL